MKPNLKTPLMMIVLTSGLTFGLSARGDEVVSPQVSAATQAAPMNPIQQEAATRTKTLNAQIKSLQMQAQADTHIALSTDSQRVQR